MSFEISLILKSTLRIGRTSVKKNTKTTKYSFSCFMIFKHVYRSWKRVLHSSKILDNVLIALSNEMSSDFQGSIILVYILFSWELNFFNNNVTFSSSDQSRHLFEKIISYLLKYAGNVTLLLGSIGNSGRVFEIPSSKKILDLIALFDVFSSFSKFFCCFNRWFWICSNCFWTSCSRSSYNFCCWYIDVHKDFVICTSYTILF